MTKPKTMDKFKMGILYIVYIVNLIANTIYCIYDMMGKRLLGKFEFLILVIFQAISFVIFAELLHKKDKPKKA